MGRIIGQETATASSDYYDRNRHGWFRYKVVVQRWLHSTKGWRKAKVQKSEERIPFHKTSGPFETRTFKRY